MTHLSREYITIDLHHTTILSWSNHHMWQLCSINHYNFSWQGWGWYLLSGNPEIVFLTQHVWLVLNLFTSVNIGVAAVLPLSHTYTVLVLSRPSSVRNFPLRHRYPNEIIWTAVASRWRGSLRDNHPLVSGGIWLRVCIDPLTRYYDSISLQCQMI